MASHKQAEVAKVTKVKGDTDRYVHRKALIDILSSMECVGHDYAEQAKTRGHL